jgi:membrane associated rhomboid family serine protease
VKFVFGAVIGLLLGMLVIVGTVGGFVSGLVVGWQLFAVLDETPTPTSQEAPVT